MVLYWRNRFCIMKSEEYTSLRNILRYFEIYMTNRIALKLVSFDSVVKKFGSGFLKKNLPIIESCI